MKINKYKYISVAALTLLSACDDIDPVYTVGEADNAIRLEAGVVDGGTTVKTRANWDAEDATRHGKHLALASGIKMQLQVSGIWKGHKKANNELDENIVYSPTATVKAVSGEEKHNAIEFSPAIYWDDYGTADPSNKKPGNIIDGGREKGLTIYAIAYNDASSSMPIINNETGKAWDGFNCSVSNDQTSGWTKSDLIISNNVQASEVGKDYTGTLKFDSQSEGNLLEFKHVMSKVTFILTAGKGFPDGKFEGEPTVQMHGFYTSGTVNVTNGETSAPSGNIDSESKPTNIETYCENTTKTGQEKVTRSALVFPNRTIAADDHIATVTADGNIYKISAAKIYAAMTKAASGSEPAGPGATMLSGYNYILKITVDKTEVHVEATVANWIDVIADEDYPKIDITVNYGTGGNNFGKDYSFYHSVNKYYVEGRDFYGTLAQDATLYGSNRTFVNSTGKFNSELYWPNHNTKYFFRGIWPETTTNASEALVIGDATSVDSKMPTVSVFKDQEEKKHQGIYVRNMKYSVGTFPSDLMLAIPTLNVQDTEERKTEPADGIGATEGKISMNFTYRMAQVEVHLLSSGKDQPDNIDFGSDGGAEIAQVSIINGMTEGFVILADGSVVFEKGKTSADYVMTPKSSELSGVEIPDATTYGGTMNWTDYPTLVRHDAIIPQSLGTDAAPLKFVIKTGSNTLTYDTYSIPIKDIKLTSINGVACTEANNKITEWEAGKHYIYTLKITKTKVNIEATILDWIPVVAGGDFWL